MIQFLVSVGSVGLTIIFGVLGVAITIYALNKPRLKYYQINPGKLFSEKTSDLARLEIKYNGQQIDGKLIFLQALINNEGNCDIDSNSIYEPLTITYRKPFEIIDAFIENGDANNIKLERIDNSLAIKWDLLKKNESFAVNVVLKHDKDNKCGYSVFSFMNKYTEIKSRIKNIYNIKKESYTTVITKNNILVFSISLFVMFVLTSFISFSMIKLNNIERNREKIFSTAISLSSSLLEINKNLIDVFGTIIEFTEGNSTIDVIEDKIKNISLSMNKTMSQNVDVPETELLMPISLVDINLDVAGGFALALLFLLLAIYTCINYFKMRRISKYLK